VPVLPLAARLSAPLKKSPVCREGTLEGFRLERERGKQGEGRREEMVGSWGEPGPPGTLPASAVCASLPALPCNELGGSSQGPREGRDGASAAPQPQRLPRSTQPSAEGRGGEKPPLLGARRVLESHSRQKTMLPLRRRGELNESRGGNMPGQVGAPLTSHPSRGRWPGAPRGRAQTGRTWDHPAKGGCGCCETKFFQHCVQSFQLNRALAQHLLPAMPHTQDHPDRADTSLSRAHTAH